MSTPSRVAAVLAAARRFSEIVLGKGIVVAKDADGRMTLREEIVAEMPRELRKIIEANG